MSSSSWSSTNALRPTTFLRFVIYDKIADYEQLGWMVAADNHNNYHGIWGVIMEWRCACRILEPHRSIHNEFLLS